jgi:mannose-6-phosphate isomerase-like protein (cupin superfamily)
MVKISRTQALSFQADAAVIIEKLFDGKDFAFDVVVGRINGHHPKRVNKVSDRAYFVLEGEITFWVGDAVYHCTKDDLVTVPANTPHASEGKGSYLVITAPSFAPENEELITD